MRRLMTSPFGTELEVPVAGGSLHVAVSGPLSGKPVVLAAHGITASHVSWAAVARHLADDVTFVAADLRGRGGSSSLTGPYGINAHVADLIAVLDYIGAVKAVLVGHSMGAFVVGRLASAHPDRGAAVVLVDGGVALPLPDDRDPDEVLEMVLGPALARLRMTFASVDAYRDFWRAHPAFAGNWSDDAEAYVDYDLEGSEPELRSRVSEEAVRSDGRDILLDSVVRDAVRGIGAPTVLLRAPRGLMNEENPLIPDDQAARCRDEVPGLVEELVPDTNHYLIVLGDREAKVVADRIRVAAQAAQ
jgi:pimeloyl-ACP methyl ester carboxylesterase